MWQDFQFKERPESAPEGAQKEENQYEGARLYRQYRGCRVHHRHESFMMNDDTLATLALM